MKILKLYCVDDKFPTVIEDPLLSKHLKALHKWFEESKAKLGDTFGRTEPYLMSDEVDEEGNHTLSYGIRLKSVWPPARFEDE